MKCHTVLITTVVLEFTCSKLQKACISFPSQVVSIFIRVRGIVKWNKLTKSFVDLIVCICNQIFNICRIKKSVVTSGNVIYETSIMPRCCNCGRKGPKVKSNLKLHLNTNITQRKMKMVVAWHDIFSVCIEMWQLFLFVYAEVVFCLWGESGCGLDLVAFFSLLRP